MSVRKTDPSCDSVLFNGIDEKEEKFPSTLVGLPYKESIGNLGSEHVY